MSSRKSAIAQTVAQAVYALVVFGFIIALAASGASDASAKTITVTSTADTVAVDGVVTLREAITAANTNASSGDAPAGDPGLDVINFNIPGSGVQTINLTSALPTITEPITIDGYTQQPCSNNPAPCSKPNTLAVGGDASLLIELNGAGAGSGATGLYITAGNSSVRGLVINRFTGRGIYIGTKGNNVIAGNFIGTNASGTAAMPSPNNIQGIYLSTANNTIGGTTPADRNVISGNGVLGPGGNGILMDTANATGNKVIGNYIGTNASGMAGVANIGNGIWIIDAKSNIIGGTTASERNVISGYSYGVYIIGSSSNNQVMGNYIGTKADGSKGIANNDGVAFSGAASNNTIGGTQAGAGNVIAYSNGPGVILTSKNINNAILGNSIYSNGSGIYVGIDLFTGAYGVTPNDDNTGDADTGANNLQNFPVLTSVTTNGGTTTIKGTLDSAFNTQFRVEFFSNNKPSPTGFGEGETFLGFTSIMTDAGGHASFTFNVPTASVVGNFFTATATDPNGSTSEFSAVASGIANSPGTLQLSTGYIGLFEKDGSFNINVTRTGGTSGTVTVQYTTVDWTATAPGDYTTTAGTLTFADGEASKSITVPIVDDKTPEVSKALKLTLSNPTGGAVLGSLTTAQLSIQDDDYPAFSISDVSVAEGNSGTTDAVFTITLSEKAPYDAKISFATTSNGGTAISGNDYQPTSGSLTFVAGETSKTVTVIINGDTTQEPDETFFVQLSGNDNSTIAKSKGTCTILDDDSVQPAAVEFGQSSYSVQEDQPTAKIIVNRSGDLTSVASVDFITSDQAGMTPCQTNNTGNASERCDYATTAGTLRFAAGEAQKTIEIPIINDAYVEQAETFNLTLRNPQNIQLGNTTTTTVTITSEDAQLVDANPIDEQAFFIKELYIDFLGRLPDTDGFANWQNTLKSCPGGGYGLQNPDCDRVHIAQSFYQSEEFQTRGYWAYRFYDVALGRRPNYAEFIPDMALVGGPKSPQEEQASKQQFIDAFVQRQEFKNLYDAKADPAAFVDAVLQTAGLPNLSIRSQLISQLQANQITRAQALRQIVEAKEVEDGFYNRGFVTMMYFGFLRRDADPTGFNNYLNNLSQTGDWTQKVRQMVFDFIYSDEYRGRFGHL